MVGFHQNKRPSVLFPWRSCPSVFLLVDTNRAHRAKTPSERARVPKSLAPSNDIRNHYARVASQGKLPAAGVLSLPVLPTLSSLKKSNG